MLTEVDSADHSGVLILNSAFRGWFRSSRSSNNRSMHCDGAGARRPFKRRQRWRVCRRCTEVSDLSAVVNDKNDWCREQERL